MKKLFAVVLGIIGVASVAAAKAPEATKVTHPDWSRNAVIYEVNTRQFTPEGTFNAFREHLPRLKDLGVDILWFMPIHPISEDGRKGTLGSYYAVKDYKAVNPEFGTLDDFKKVVDEAHKLGMKVILDWVPNHSGRDNAWVTEHPDWYERNEKGEMYGPYDWTDVYEFDYSNPEMRRGMVDALSFWLRDVGTDGYRCDVAMEVPTDFWNETRPILQAIKPDLFMLAESSNADLAEEGFDMVYNWPMKDLFSEIAATSGQYTFNDRTFPEKHAIDIIGLLEKQRAEFPVDTYFMNMVTNHDLNSWEGTEFQRLGNLTNAFAVLSYTLPGMPLIYTGQETGMNRAFEFFEKDNPPMWEPRNTYFTFYQKLNALKHNNKALNAGAGSSAGSFPTVYPAKSDDILVFERQAEGKNADKVLVMVNLGTTEQPVAFKGKKPSVKGMKDYFSGNKAVIPATLKPGDYYVFVNK